MENTGRNYKLTRRSLLIGTASLTIMRCAAHAASPSITHVTSPRILGKANAPIKIIEMFSMTCPACASFHNDTFPDVKKRLIDTGMVSFEMQPFPLDQIALRAHALVRSLPQRKYFPMVAMLLKDIERWAQNPDPLTVLLQMARFAGMSAAEFDAVMTNRLLLEAIVTMRQNANKTWKIERTPSFVINNETIISGYLSYEEFVSKIELTDT